MDKKYTVKIKVVDKKAINKANEKIESELKKKEKRIKDYRKEASRLTSLANKRLKRLEKNNLQDSPAYKKWLEQGGQKFGIKGKDYNQVQQEVARLRNFINSETSTVRGVNRVLKEMANNTGIKYKSMKDLREKSKQFFELASKVEQYLRTVEDMASAIGYQKIWESVNKYVKMNNVDLGNSENNIEELTQKITKAMDIYNEKERIDVKGDFVNLKGWFQLDKE